MLTDEAEEEKPEPKVEKAKVKKETSLVFAQRRFQKLLR